MPSLKFPSQRFCYMKMSHLCRSKEQHFCIWLDFNYLKTLLMLIQWGKGFLFSEWTWFCHGLERFIHKDHHTVIGLNEVKSPLFCNRKAFIYYFFSLSQKVCVFCGILRLFPIYRYNKSYWNGIVLVYLFI